MIDVSHYSARLLVSCADRPGIVAAVSGLLFDEGANVVSSSQWSSDPTVINIHHSFLPAFAGADPYERARGGAASS